MIDWNHDGKVDGWEHGMTAFMIDELSKDDKGSNGGTGCCGPTVAMFLIGLILPVIVGVVFIAR